MTYTNAIKHSKDTQDQKPCYMKQYRQSRTQHEEIQKQVDEMLENKVIKPANSPYNFLLLVVPKKEDANGNISDTYPLP